MSLSSDPPPVKPLSPFWRWLEGYFQRKYDVRTLDDDPKALLAYNLYPHSGAPVSLASGQTIQPGDCILEIHFRREALLPLIADGDPRRVGLALLRMGERDLPRLAAALEREPRLREVKALHALTLFHRGINHIGFEIVPIQEWWVERWFSWWHQLLMARDAATGSDRVKRHKQKLVTKHIWMAREEFVRRYGAAGDGEEERMRGRGLGQPGGLNRG